MIGRVRLFHLIGAVLLMFMLSSNVNSQTIKELRPILDAQKGKRKIVLEPGTYLLDNAEKGGYKFADLADVEIIGNGAKIICNLQEQAFRFSNCKRVKISNLSIDYDPLCFTQGKIVAIDQNNSWFEIEIDKGYPIENVDNHRVNFYNAATRNLKANSITTYSGNYKSMEKTGERTFKLIKNGIWNANEKIGDLVALDVKANKKYTVPHTIQLEKCENMKLEDITIYGSNSFSFYERECSSTHYNRCRVDRGASPEGISPRLRSGNADGIHSALAKIGPLVENCEVGYNGDDGIIVCGRSFPVYKVDPEKNTIYILSRDVNPAFYAGDVLQHVFNNGIKAGKMKLLAIDKFMPGEKEKNFLQENIPGLLSKDGYKTGILLRVEALPKDIKQGDILYNENYIGKGFVIRNNKTGNTRSRGILIKGSQGVVLNNEISNCAMNGILVAPEIQWMGGGFSDDIQIKGNTITNCMFEKTTSGMAPGALSVFYSDFSKKVPPAAGAFHKIVIENNKISNSPYPAIVTTSVKGLTQKGNEIKPDKDNVREHGKIFGVKFEEPLWELNNTK